MKSMNIAASGELIPCLSTHRNVVALDSTDFTDVAAVVITTADSRSGILALLKRTGFHLPVFMLADEPVSAPVGVTAVIGGNAQEWLELENAASRYEAELLPPFYDTLTQYVDMGNSTFACPGHQHGEFFRKHPAGRHFYDFFGENLFRADMCNADVKLGDLLIHEGSAKHAQKFAAKVFNADKTYFVLNGTSAANKVVTNALLTRGDLVLFDRNNHKSNHHGALIQAGATPVYLEAARNPFGFIGGIDAHCFDETYLRDQIRDVMPESADASRPFRLAIIQLGTYDGTIYNARQVVDKIGHLCDYILFDSAWVGYEQFINMMADTSPLRLELNENDPGIFVTQSVHKQQAGFSQTSQIHKKDNHIRGQARFCPHKRLNNAFMLHASTSPFYPLFAALDINAKIHEGESGRRLWAECVALGIDARKAILARCKLLQPFIPLVVDGKPWQAYPTETILAHYLRENGIVPEKCDLNSILFLLTPAESEEKLARLVAMLAQFERHIEDDTPLADVLPTVFQKYPVRYRDYTLRELCQEMHNLYVSFDVKDLQKAMFRKESLPHVAMNPQDANSAFIRGDVELVRISEAGGRIAAEGALPYPPGVLCVVPGEIWGGAAQRYFLALEEGINLLPGFSPELQGVYSETDADGIQRLYGYVLK
ncbi:ornithine decarboxylase [Salmonella enterica subsp. enterica serovar Dublin]|uniref:ornithine decarboxylase n=1 Tax=Salmonella enterica TaxID=28901 RepID=UPI000D3BD6CB|nr:ornithine decarboxylase [Salmonella enterica]PUK43635.1 ornithine decarboxylase [Salmonella enterica subsp. enterica serovar Dublin]